MPFGRPLGSLMLEHSCMHPCPAARQPPLPPPPPPRYDVELYQKIEALIDMKLEAYPAEQEAVLVLLERVSEAQRIATMQMKETDSRKRGRKSAVDDDERDAEGGARGGKSPPRKR